MREPFFFSFFLFFLRANLEYDLFNKKKESDIFVCLFGLWFGGRVVFCFPRKSQMQGEKGKYFRWEKCSFLWSLPSAIKQWPEFQIAAFIFSTFTCSRKKWMFSAMGGQCKSPRQHCYAVAVTWMQTRKWGSLKYTCSVKEETKSWQTCLNNHHKDPRSDSPVAYIH